MSDVLIAFRACLFVLDIFGLIVTLGLAQLAAVFTASAAASSSGPYRSGVWHSILRSCNSPQLGVG